jgi:hypothetical protein
MTKSDDVPKYTDCKPQNSMGTLWICNHAERANCPHALQFGYVYLCNNRTLYIIE